MPEFSGKDLVFQWIYSGGTVTLTGDQRSVSLTPGVKLVDTTAGSDADETFLATLKSGAVAFAGVLQTGGTALEDALVEGTFGTLIVGPEGTAAGKRKYTIPAFSLGAKMNWPYSDVCEVTCDWTKSGAMTRGVY